MIYCHFFAPLWKNVGFCQVNFKSIRVPFDFLLTVEGNIKCKLTHSVEVHVDVELVEVEHWLWDFLWWESVLLDHDSSAYIRLVIWIVQLSPVSSWLYFWQGSLLNLRFSVQLFAGFPFVVRVAKYWHCKSVFYPVVALLPDPESVVVRVRFVVEIWVIHCPVQSDSPLDWH